MLVDLYGNFGNNLECSKSSLPFSFSLFLLSFIYNILSRVSFSAFLFLFSLFLFIVIPQTCYFSSPENGLRDARYLAEVLHVTTPGKWRSRPCKLAEGPVHLEPANFTSRYSTEPFK
jgi:hypothetical protein